MWERLKNPDNRAVLGWLGGGLVVFVGGTWTVFKFFYEPPAPAPTTVIATEGGVAAGRDVYITGPTLKQFSEALKQRENELRAELRAAAAAERRVLEAELAAVEERRRVAAFRAPSRCAGSTPG